jgi:hypothetical protein
MEVEVFYIVSTDPATEVAEVEKHPGVGILTKIRMLVLVDIQLELIYV